ncbi:MAG: HD domain-containing phosphohydrolase [Actinomycetota bacterium]
MPALSSDPSGPARLLVAEGDEGVRRDLVEILDRRGYSCVAVGSATEAFDLLRDETFEAILTDLDLPGGTGLDLLMKVTTDGSNVAPIVVTRADDPSVAEAAIETGAYGYIIEPFQENEVLINVASALRRRHAELEGRSHANRLEEMVRARTGEMWNYISQLEKAEREMRTLQDETIQRLSLAAEFRDNESPRHIQRMSRYCALLADRLGLSAERCELIRVASALHDVGKIGIPDHILLKPGSLNAGEWETMKRHCGIGHRILSGSNSELLNTAATIAFTHHERYDGTGYPQGLAGEDIPLEGRIAAIADVFDALTSNKVYRRAIKMSEAIAIMKDERGKQFDPTLLDLFLGEKGQILGIKERYADLLADEVELNELSALAAES